MALAGSGQLTLSEIATEYSDSAPHGLSEFYDAASGVPSSGVISISDFHGTSAAISTTFSSSILNADLYDVMIAAGHSSSAISGNTIFNVTINSGVTMKGNSTGGGGGKVGTYNFSRYFSDSDHGDSASGGAGSPRTPLGGCSQRAGNSRECLTIEGLPNSCTVNIVNNGTFEGGAGMGGHGPQNNHGPWHGHYQHVSGGTGGAPISCIDQDSCTINITNNGTMRAGGGGGSGGGFGAGHNSCCPKWGGDGQGHNRGSEGGQGGSHGGNAGGSGAGYGGNGQDVGGCGVGGLGGPLVELRSCSGTSVNVLAGGTQSVATTTRNSNSWRS
jgi:hypothetical protein